MSMSTLGYRTLKTDKTKKKFGYIYGIKCLANNKWYIGSTVNVEQRMRYHLSWLQEGIANKHLQEDFDKFGIDAFVYMTLSPPIPFYDRKILFEIEEVFCKAFMAEYPTGYCDNIGAKLGEEVKEKISKSRKNIDFAAIGLKRRGIKFSETGKQAISNGLKQKWQSEEFRERMKNRKWNHRMKPCKINDMFFKRINDAAEYFKLDRKEIAKRCKSDTFSDWQFMTKDEYNYHINNIKT